MTNAEIVLGAMNYGTTVDEHRAVALLDTFVERGGTWIDTADCYSFWNDPSGVGGASERVLGRWLAARPGAPVKVATKVRHQPLVPHRWPESAEGLSADAIRAGLAGSLERLGVGAVDLLWAHAEDRSVPLEETVATFGELAAAGTARRLGASNHAAWRVERARAIAAGLGVEPWTAIQLRHSYVTPRPGAWPPGDGHTHASPEQLDHAAAEGLTVWAYTPLINGGYVRDDRPLPEPYDHPGTTRRLAALGEVAKETGATANQVVLAWLTGGTPAVSPILGVSTVAQLDECMAARDLVLDADQRARLDAAA
jgi:aryl-alcohol dehydrogenase-like predicted oxidoreductase